MQATARMASVVSSTLPARRRLIRNVRPTQHAIRHEVPAMPSPYPTQPQARAISWHCRDDRIARMAYSVFLLVHSHHDHWFYIGRRVCPIIVRHMD